MGKTYYETLGIAENARAEEIEAAFKAKAREVHPDAVPAENTYLRKVAAEAFKDLSEAKAILLDPRAREKYDAGLAYARGSRQTRGGPTSAPPPSPSGPRTQTVPSPTPAQARAQRRVRRIVSQSPSTRSTTSLLFMVLGLGAIFSLGVLVWSGRTPPVWLAGLTACFGILSFLHGMRPGTNSLLGTGNKPLIVAATMFAAIFVFLLLLSAPSDDIPLVTRYVAPALAGVSKAKAPRSSGAGQGTPSGPTVTATTQSGEDAAMVTKIWRNLKDGQNYRAHLRGDVLSLDAITGDGKNIGEITSCEFHRTGLGTQSWIGVCSERKPTDQGERKASAAISKFSDTRIQANTADIPVFELTPVESAPTGTVPSPGADMGEADLSGVGALEKQSIASACASDKLMEGPAAYNGCVRKQLDALKTAPKAPDLSRLSSPDRDGIELTCANAKLIEGPAAYNACLVRQVELLKKRR